MHKIRLSKLILYTIIGQLSMVDWTDIDDELSQLICLSEFTLHNGKEPDWYTSIFLIPEDIAIVKNFLEENSKHYTECYQKHMYARYKRLCKAENINAEIQSIDDFIAEQNKWFASEILKGYYISVMLDDDLGKFRRVLEQYNEANQVAQKEGLYYNDNQLAICIKREDLTFRFLACVMFNNYAFFDFDLDKLYKSLCHDLSRLNKRFYAEPWIKTVQGRTYTEKEWRKTVASSIIIRR